LVSTSGTGDFSVKRTTRAGDALLVSSSTSVLLPKLVLARVPTVGGGGAEDANDDEVEEKEEDDVENGTGVGTGADNSDIIVGENKTTNLSNKLSTNKQQRQRQQRQQRQYQPVIGAVRVDQFKSISKIENVPQNFPSSFPLKLHRIRFKWRLIPSKLSLKTWKLSI
jgi:hypothetical protein